jgi:hypothetical protein
MNLQAVINKIANLEATQKIGKTIQVCDEYFPWSVLRLPRALIF